MKKSVQSAARHPQMGQNMTTAIPVFRDGHRNGFVHRSSQQAAREECARERHFGEPADDWIRQRVLGALHGEAWIGPEFVGATVENGVIRLFGELDCMHAVLAIHRIAAAVPGATAIIDDLWVDCE
jgi:osmotically-inducible protein OsmY